MLFFGTCRRAAPYLTLATATRGSQRQRLSCFPFLVKITTCHLGRIRAINYSNDTHSELKVTSPDRDPPLRDVAVDPRFGLNSSFRKILQSKKTRRTFKHARSCPTLSKKNGTTRFRLPTLSCTAPGLTWTPITLGCIRLLSCNCSRIVQDCEPRRSHFMR